MLQECLLSIILSSDEKLTRIQQKSSQVPPTEDRLVSGVENEEESHEAV